ncbi:hypothetical protein [Spongiibacter sp.]|uniref:hypothetical protein n=1 Tax=Spongiibacter sp. TaxID=2024860 RepID=UPI000C3640E8|nr:hypothetical protein [Spongiibacter sp.]MBU71859.1 hypothetical protein [Spongiibacter sp.]HCP19605.1 hypothetical protein [Marinobacter nauticus]|tara:strand:- start:27840 stop:28262 length:423 start_codon:yes stop_codon:yes gene_type:complete
MSDTLIINSEIALAQAQRKLAEMWRENKYVEVEFRRKAKQRTLTQNRALHLFCQWLADTLNDAGYDMRKTLRQDVDIPWTQESVKEHLWRPIQIAMTDKRSTTEITTVEPTEIHAVLSRHLGQKLGIACPAWPKREDKAA